MTDDEAAVIEAVKRWLAAKEAMLGADADHTHEGEPSETERALDQAEYDLTEAAYSSSVERHACHRPNRARRGQVGNFPDMRPGVFFGNSPADL